MAKLFRLVDVKLYYNDEKDLPNNERNYLCAVGVYDENDKECQEWDDQIFYYFDSHEELERAKIFVDEYEFTVLSYEYR